MAGDKSIAMPPASPVLAEDYALALEKDKVQRARPRRQRDTVLEQSNNKDASSLDTCGDTEGQQGTDAKFVRDESEVAGNLNVEVEHDVQSRRAKVRDWLNTTPVSREAKHPSVSNSVMHHSSMITVRVFACSAGIRGCCYTEGAGPRQ
jgi:hypothetical protein